MNIAILGLGKLGSAMAALYASVGHTVFGMDTDDGLLERLQAGTFHTDEPEVNDLLRTHAANLKFERMTIDAVLKADIVFIVVPTPSKADGTFNSEHVVTAARRIGVALHDKDSYTLVVVVSTLMPGQMDADVLPALEQTSGKRAGVDFGLCYSPEFIALGRVVEGLRKPDYILIGTSMEESHSGELGRLADFYETVTPAPFRPMSFVNAELTKLATNAYLSLKIAYANVLGQICEALPGANVDVVTQAVGADHRVGGAYLRAGLPAGGVCLPRDLIAIAALEEGVGISAFFETAGDWNEDAYHHILSHFQYVVKKDCRVAVLGTGYSATSSIKVESYGDRILRDLTHTGYTMYSDYIDPQRAQELVDQVDAVIIALPQEYYRSLQFKSGQVVFDLWRVLDPAQVPDGVTLWQLGVGATASPYKGAIKGKMTTLSVSPDEFDGGFEDE